MISYAADALEHYLTWPVVLTALLCGACCAWACARAVRQKRIGSARGVALTALCVYLVLIFGMLIFVRAVKGGRHFNFELFWSYRAIARGRRYLLHQDLLNVLLFVPFGVLCQLSLRRPCFWKVLCAGTALSILVEVLQGLTERGLFELDDLFHNIVGTAVGAGALALFLYCRSRRTRGTHDVGDGPVQRVGEKEA
ncbi:MAG: VanZ family protein [Oscillospiraceae bacterium]|nr:VanZ family protein [Oscillospiraceae bacterium]